MSRFKKTVGTKLSAVVLVLATSASILAAGASARATSAQSIVGSRDWLGGAGVAVCYPVGAGTCVDRSTGQVVRPSETGYGWQCVELAVRFWNTMGWQSGWFGGNGQDFFSWAVRTPGVARAYPNGSVPTPVHGDLISVRAGGGRDQAGHVAVVDYTDAQGNVHVMEQNASSTGRAIYHLSGGRLTRTGDGRTILGVVHALRNSAGSGYISRKAQQLVFIDNLGTVNSVLIQGPNQNGVISTYCLYTPGKTTLLRNWWWDTRTYVYTYSGSNCTGRRVTITLYIDADGKTPYRCLYDTSPYTDVSCQLGGDRQGGPR